MNRSILRNGSDSSLLTNVTASPEAPARPVRPILWM
jgi:hypothetical protein